MEILTLPQGLVFNPSDTPKNIKFVDEDKLWFDDYLASLTCDNSWKKKEKTFNIPEHFTNGHICVYITQPTFLTRFDISYVRTHVSTKRCQYIYIVDESSVEIARKLLQSIMIIELEHQNQLAVLEKKHQLKLQQTNHLKDLEQQQVKNLKKEKETRWINYLKIKYNLFPGKFRIWGDQINKNILHVQCNNMDKHVLREHDEELYLFLLNGPSDITIN